MEKAGVVLAEYAWDDDRTSVCIIY